MGFNVYGQRGADAKCGWPANIDEALRDGGVLPDPALGVGHAQSFEGWSL